MVSQLVSSRSSEAAVSATMGSTVVALPMVHYSSIYMCGLYMYACVCVRCSSVAGAIDARCAQNCVALLQYARASGCQAYGVRMYLGLDNLICSVFKLVEGAVLQLAGLQAQPGLHFEY